MSKDMRRRDRFEKSKQRFASGKHKPRTQKDAKGERKAPSENSEMRISKRDLQSHAQGMIEYFDSNKCYDSVVHYQGKYPENHLEPGEEPCPEMYFVKSNVVDYVLSLPKDPKFGVENFASAKHAGGGFLNGSMAQEEALCYSTGLYQSLKDSEEAFKTYRLNEKDPRNGLYHDFITVSKGVKIYYDSKLEEVPERKIDIYTSPAVNAGIYRLRCKGDEETVNQEIYLTMKDRVDNLLKTMIYHGNTKLVIGPWGCGVFKGNLIHLMQHIKESDYTPFMEEIHFISTSGREVEIMRQCFS